MNNRERTKAILNYENYDRMPVVHFGYWYETLEKWHAEGHITENEFRNWNDADEHDKRDAANEYDRWNNGNEYDKSIASKLGFDFNWHNVYSVNTWSHLYPPFKYEVVKVLPDGSKHIRDDSGVILLEKNDAGSIPMEIDHLLKDRESWEEHYLPRLQSIEDRMNQESLLLCKEDSKRDAPLGLHCGSLFGVIRNWVGVENISYLYADDKELYDEMIETVAQLNFKLIEATLRSGAKFDFAHFWEDICFKNGPLVIPGVFDEKVGHHYKKITDLLKSYGIDIISLDCDGMIDSLIPTWFNNGVNVMFPIEVGTWHASIKPWREKYGKELRGVGGMDKKVFAYDYNAIDKEIERLRPLIELGGFIPCPDHRIPPDAKWDNVRYYCDKMKETF